MFCTSLFRTVLLSSLLLAATACQSLKTNKALMTYTPNVQQISALPAAFPQELPYAATDASHEEQSLGCAFAREGDFYRAITAFKRALFLIPRADHPTREKEISYQIALAYYLGEKYLDTAKTYSLTPLSQVTPEFIAYEDLAVILYDSYLRLADHEDQAEYVRNALAHVNPKKAQDLALYHAILQQDWDTILQAADTDPSRAYFHSIAKQYHHEKKSVGKAHLLSAIFPGSGYWYVGQKKSALTSFLLNALFIWGTFEFLDHHLYAPAIITAGFEVGWYAGGIFGAGMAAKEYNSQLYEKYSYKMLQQERLFPFLMLHYGF